MGKVSNKDNTITYTLFSVLTVDFEQVFALMVIFSLLLHQGSCRLDVFCKKQCFENFTKFTGVSVLESIF